jgi:hypothetical protein
MTAGWLNRLNNAKRLAAACSTLEFFCNKYSSKKKIIFLLHHPKSILAKHHLLNNLRSSPADLYFEVEHGYITTAILI